MTKEAFIQVKRATVEQWLEALDLAQALLEKSNHHSKILDAYTAIKEALARPEQERNFCPRCGKRTADLTVIHTCTPPTSAMACTPALMATKYGWQSTTMKTRWGR